MAEQQLEIEGIGQQKATLEDWKRENKIYTHYFDGAKELDQLPWSCWDEIEEIIEFSNTYSCEAIALGETEKEAIIKFCADNEIKLPFWW